MKTFPLIASFFLHVGTLLVGGLLHQNAAFGIDSGRSSLEVNLVAAAPESQAQEIQESSPTPADTTPTPDDDADLAIPMPKPVQQEKPSPTPSTPPVAKQIRPPVLAPDNQKEHGDGSSPKPGKDKTTAQSEAGAIISVKPDYLRNPAPAYPEAARVQKQQGVVVLKAIISTEGRPEQVAVQESSGYPLLDQAALRAVRDWRFRPATAMGMKMRSSVQVPVRFRLES